MRASFDVLPKERFTQAGAKIKRPSEITCFSYDDQHVLHHDARSLKYYYTPELGVPLADGYDTFRKHDDSNDEHLIGLLSALVRLEQKRKAVSEQRIESETNAGLDDAAAPSEANDRVRPHVVTWRGMITKLMSSPYDDRDGFQMNATFLDGTIYIEDCHAAKVERNKEQSRKSQPRRGFAGQDMMSYWGYKFESLCLLPDTWDNTPREFIESRPNHVVSNYEQYVSVVETRIGDTTLILGGEVDGVWDFLPDDATSPSADATTTTRNYVELKTSAELDQRSAPRFEMKLLKFWIQSFLLGVPRVIVGFRTNDGAGRLLRVQEYATTAIPKMVREQGLKSWDSSVCINFLSEFLKFLRAAIETDVKTSAVAPGAAAGVWRIERRPKSSMIEVYRTEEHGHGGILSLEWITWRETGDPLAAAKAGLMDRL